MNQLQELISVEEDLAESLAAAGKGLQELSKDKPNNRSIEQATSAFISRLDQASSKIFRQLTYLTRATAGQPAEGFGGMNNDYGDRKRLEYAKDRLKKLETPEK